MSYSTITDSRIYDYKSDIEVKLKNRNLLDTFLFMFKPISQQDHRCGKLPSQFHMLR